MEIDCIKSIVSLFISFSLESSRFFLNRDFNMVYETEL